MGAHVPVTNPNLGLPLSSVTVGFTGGADVQSKRGRMKKVHVRYGNKQISDPEESEKHVINSTVNTATRSKQAHTPSKGVTVALDLHLPDAGSYIVLYSVEPLFQPELTN